MLKTNKKQLQSEQQVMEHKSKRIQANSRKNQKEKQANDGELLTSLISTVDPSDLKSDFDQWPALGSSSWFSNVSQKVTSSPRSIVISGLGGSGIVGELISDLFGEQRSARTIHVLKDYHLPANIDESSIVLGISCSGNTEETLSVLYEASSRGLKCFTFGTGGELETLSATSNFTFTRTSALKVPRSSLPGIFYPVLRFFAANSLVDIEEKDVEESLRVLSSVQQNCSNLKGTNKALNIAKSLTDVKVTQFPLVYASKRTRAVGMRFRQSLNENAKMHAFDGIVPELCHNDIVGWDAATSQRVRSNARSGSRKQDLQKNPVVLLRLPDDPPEISTRFEIVSDIIKNNDGLIMDAPYEGASYLARTLSMLYWLDYSSYFAAILRGINPISTPSIDLLKRELKSRLGYLDKLPMRKTRLIS